MSLLLGDPHLPYFARLVRCRAVHVLRLGSFSGIPLALPHPLERSELVGGGYGDDAFVPRHDRLASIKPDAHVSDEDGFAGVGDDRLGLISLAALALPPFCRECDVGDSIYREDSVLIWEGLNTPNRCCFWCYCRRHLDGGHHPQEVGGAHNNMEVAKHHGSSEVTTFSVVGDDERTVCDRCHLLQMTCLQVETGFSRRLEQGLTDRDREANRISLDPIRFPPNRLESIRIGSILMALSHTQESARRFIEVAWVPLHRVGQKGMNRQTISAIFSHHRD
ncbi:hypothetical protein Taro_034024, partial [Colocasia esculenta]|nr:hypothetical protein [Colocasia esculenta]